MYRSHPFNRKVRLLRGSGMPLVLLLIMVSSCVTQRKTTYLQENFSEDFEAILYEPEKYKVVPNDNLYIRVITPDPRFSDMFNTVPVSATTMSIDGQAVDLLSYTVQNDGTIEIPYVGRLDVGGKTLPEIKVLLETSLSNYVTDAALTVKLVNNYISVLGQVVRPGRYPVYKEKMNVFHALAMAGDLSDYGDRSTVRVIRQLPDTVVVKEFDLRDRNLIHQEDFFVMPNDVIYVKSMRGKFFAMTQFPFALILSSITTFVLVMNYIQPD